MNIEEIRGLATSELEKQSVDCREELFKLHYAQISESVENTKNVRELRKRIARMKTILCQRKLAEKAETAGAKG